MEEKLFLPTRTQKKNQTASFLSHYGSLCTKIIKVNHNLVSIIANIKCMSMPNYEPRSPYLMPIGFSKVNFCSAAQEIQTEISCFNIFCFQCY